MKKNSNFKPIKKYILTAKVKVKNAVEEKTFFDCYGFYNSTKDAVKSMKVIKEYITDTTKVQFKIAKVTFYERINH